RDERTNEHRLLRHRGVRRPGCAAGRPARARLSKAHGAGPHGRLRQGLMSPTILVTGATGFVMANLVRHLAERGHDVVAADIKPPDPPMRRFLESLSGSVSFRPVDVTDRAAVFVLVQEVRPARAVHGAAITSIPLDVERARFVESADVNVTGTLNVLAALAQARTSRVVAISSGSVYGPRAGLTPIGEEDGKDPRGGYPMTKWAGDMLARRFAGVHGLDLAVARLAGPFGPFERDSGSRPPLSPIAGGAAGARGRDG